MKRRKESSAMPQGYMDALGKLYGKQPNAGPKTAPESTQPAPPKPVKGARHGK
jgi:hypothetical protein